MTEADDSNSAAGEGIVHKLRASWTDPALRRSVLRFGVVGVAATLMHGAVLNLLVLAAGMQPTLANVGAFLCAFSVSYFGHYYFSFQSSENHSAAAPKFFAVALLGLVLNTLIFALVVDMLRFHYMIAFAIVIVLVPGLTFLISKRFVFFGNGRAN